MANVSKFAILHFALNPVTGPWSVMRDLALAQARSGLYESVGIGVTRSNKWPTSYESELQTLEIPCFMSKTLEIFGTGQFLWQRFQIPPIRDWARELANQAGCERVVVHFHNAWMSGVFLPLPGFPSLRIDSVATFHGVNAFLEGKPIRLALHRWMASRLRKYPARLTSVDHANISRADSEFGLSPGLFTVIPNGVTTSVLRGGHYQFGDGRGRLTLAHIGSITPQKGWRVTAEAVVQAWSAGCPVQLVIAGAGPEEEQARAFAAANPGCIEFLGHVTNPRDTLMPKVDVLCLLSDHEGLPMAIIEAMSVGLPVIATDVGGVSEAVTHGETGFLIPKSRDALVPLIADLCSNRQTLARLSQQALQAFSERFDIQRIVESYHSIYSNNE